MGIQIYNQISIARKLSKVKLHRAFSLEFGLKRLQIAQNIAKFGFHACISTGHPNLCSNFNSGNLVKSETLNITKFGMHSYLPNGHLNIWSYFNSKKLVKWETLSCTFAKVSLKGSEIAHNIVKVSVYACLLKWVPKCTFKFHFWKKSTKVHLLKFCLTILEWGPK